MEKELECTKIRDGLYLGNIRTAQDAEFLLTNKFGFIVNCSIQVPNYYESEDIRYLKFKLVRDKPHKLWDQSLKKLKKLDSFILACEEASVCCLIHSFDGSNRSLVMLTAFLMHRYRWKLGKTLEFLRSKDLFIGLSDHYIGQLDKLEAILSGSGFDLSSDWRIPYLTPDQEIVSKTFLNTQQVEIVAKQPTTRKIKRLIWKDAIEKRQSLEVKDHSKSQKSVKSKAKGKKPRKPARIEQGASESHSEEPFQFSREEYSQSQYGNEDHLFRLIKKNLQAKRIEQALEDESIKTDVSNANKQNEKVYNVTINNYIKPSINIVGGMLEEAVPGMAKHKKPKRPTSAHRSSKQKINRTQSEKEGVRSNIVLRSQSKEKSQKALSAVVNRKGEKTNSIYSKI